MSTTTAPKVMGVATAELAEAVSKLWETRENSDLTIICGSEVFEVHSWVLWPRSKFFATACHGGFKEASTKRIELPEDNPAMVKRMLQFCYGMEYSAHGGEGGEPLWISGLHTHTEMYVLADKYGLESLKECAKSSFLGKLEDWMEIDVASQPPSVHNLVSLVYNHTPESDRTLRDPFVIYVRKKWDTLSINPETKAALAESADFAFDVINSKYSTVESPGSKHKCTCGHRLALEQSKSIRAACSYNWREHVGGGLGLP